MFLLLIILIHGFLTDVQLMEINFIFNKIELMFKSKGARDNAANMCIVLIVIFFVFVLYQVISTEEKARKKM
jgi:preprotein translocase subunit SecG